MRTKIRLKSMGLSIIGLYGDLKSEFSLKCAGIRHYDENGTPRKFHKTDKFKVFPTYVDF